MSDQEMEVDPPPAEPAEPTEAPKDVAPEQEEQVSIRRFDTTNFSFEDSE